MNEPVYRDPAASIDARVDDLLGRMRVEEKLAQIGSLWLTDLVVDDRFDADHAAKQLEHGIGHVTRIGASTGLRPNESARLMNQIQRVAIEHTRLGIPVMAHEEAVAGYLARDATQFPHAIGLASTWDESLLTEVADVIRKQMVAVGARHALSPVLDVARDPRWGRVEETYGEDPYLAGRMGVAYVRGLQGEDLTRGVLATGKHFLGYAMSEGGMNHAPVQLGPRELREVYAEPFAAAIRDAGLASVMNSYSSIDGVPCAGSAAILDDLLRDELGFDGVVVADYFAVSLLLRHHGVVADEGEAGARALRSGLDLELPGRDCYGEPLRAWIDDGRVPMSVLDTAVRRVVRSKFLVGLFDEPYVDEESAAAVFDTATDRELARRAATSSIVLLQNAGDLLPLDAARYRRIAVIGPAADDARLLQGDYHYPAHLEIVYGGGAGTDSARHSFGEDLLPAADDVPSASGAFAPGPYFVDHVTPLSGIRAMAPDASVTYARGCAITGDDVSGIAEAAAVAAAADVALVFVGGRSGLTPDATVGEARDATDLGLTGCQEALVDAIVATGAPTVVVLVSGRVHAIPNVAGSVPAILQAWLPGEEGGAAIADVLFGRATPSGRLPVSMPRSVGQVPIHHDHRRGGGASMFYGAYTDSPTTPLYAFGHGLSYTTFEYSGLRVVATGSTTETVVLELDVTNTGTRPGVEVVQLYVRDEVATVVRPAQQLVGFCRVELESGATASVRFQVHPSRLAFYDEEMRFVTEPGTFTFSCGGASDRADLQLSVELPGAPAEFRQREVVATSSAVAAR
jgi:beta-glucosidase